MGVYFKPVLFEARMLNVLLDWSKKTFADPELSILFLTLAFILGVFITFFLYYGFDAISTSFANESILIKKLGVNEHFKSISRGVIDTRDIIYFLSVTFFFLFITKTRLENE